MLTLVSFKPILLKAVLEPSNFLSESMAKFESLWLKALVPIFAQQHELHDSALTEQSLWPSTWVFRPGLFGSEASSWEANERT
ncbi:hypothetical protein AK812_SmicGene32683 [Symbiodinium microadriaticum]|uniref:Uncharacterized protein n=1 Tax=Symbiodinium microadriaticum TaxID=2951 RepID=A0A1Q9CTH7_SYMMI|nr:hypothetical protein AK812_SmicGene32683 [Symbiodinium microadriaticum]